MLKRMAAVIKHLRKPANRTGNWKLNPLLELAKLVVKTEPSELELGYSRGIAGRNEVKESRG